MSKDVGAMGGKIEGPGGAVVSVPAGATMTMTTITVSQLPGATPPRGAAAVATPLRLEPSGKTFDQPVELVVDLAGVALPPGKSLTDVVILRAPQGTTDYKPLPTRVAGPSSVAAVTEHFSDFMAIVVEDAAMDPLGTCDDSVCDANMGEDCASCPGDCGLCFTTTADICGDATCDSSETCINCPYDCACTSVCEYDNGGCGNGATCTDLGGYPGCGCPAGTTDVNGDGSECVSSGSCTANSCSGFPCTDLGGEYVCECPDGYGGVACDQTLDPCVNSPCMNSGLCVPVTATTTVCECPVEWMGASCELDVDECTTGTATCDVNATCTNTPGGYTCACSSGYAGDGFTCAALVDECALGTAGCDVNATCTDLPVGFDCTCNVGYTGDGFTCL